MLEDVIPAKIFNDFKPENLCKLQDAYIAKEKSNRLSPKTTEADNTDFGHIKEQVLATGIRNLFTDIKTVAEERAASGCRGMRYHRYGKLFGFDRTIFDYVVSRLKDNGFAVSENISQQFETGDNGEAIPTEDAFYSIELSWRGAIL